MKRYLIKQINETKIDDELSHRVSRAKAFSCRQSLERGLYRDAGYINAENLNEVFIIGNTEPDEIEKIDTQLDNITKNFETLLNDTSLFLTKLAEGK